jgi:DNA helicase-2/ATP-dependent DNA helicase PcrA
MVDTSEWPLDEEQRAALEATEPAIAVLAGPGSGKTRTLSYRTRYLLESDTEGGALLLTFTNKAAAEMKSRALAAGGLATSRIQSSTFHAFGARMLKSHGDLLGIGKDFDFLDEEDQTDLAKQVAAEYRVPDRLRRWSYLRVRRQEPDPRTAAFGEIFEAAKRELNVLDYEDLIVYAAEILEGNPDLLDAYGHRYRHVLVDEFQDTNAAQFASVNALAEQAKTVSVFADDDQAIFRFAGAELANVATFVESLGAKTYPLRTNYRSAGVIVEAANRLIRSDERASRRQMQSVREGGEISLQTFANAEIEAAALAEEIDERIENGKAAGDIAILVRSGYRVRELMEELSRKGLPASDWRGATY